MTGAYAPPSAVDNEGHADVSNTPSICIPGILDRLPHQKLSLAVYHRQSHHQHRKIFQGYQSVLQQQSRAHRKQASGMLRKVNTAVLKFQKGVI
jgi:hypothetical protein